VIARTKIKAMDKTKYDDVVGQNNSNHIGKKGELY
jgi:hypothetical protein